MRILITGSNSGFGKLAALTLARQGHHVIATMRSADKGAALLAGAATEGFDIEIRRLDVCEPDSIADALADAADIDVLVNNAGFEVQGALGMIDDELMHRQLDTNVLGPLRMIRSVMPAWRERGHGVVVNVSSVVGRATSPFGGAHAASKHALEAMSEAALGGVSSRHPSARDRARSIPHHRLRVQHRPARRMGRVSVRSQGAVAPRGTHEPRLGRTLRPSSGGRCHCVRGNRPRGAVPHRGGRRCEPDPWREDVDVVRRLRASHALHHQLVRVNSPPRMPSDLSHFIAGPGFFARDRPISPHI